MATAGGDGGVVVPAPQPGRANIVVVAGSGAPELSVLDKLPAEARCVSWLAAGDQC
jgi:hypothetical protein